ncbi:MAG: methionine synthase [Bacteroidales bacterium]
MIKEDLQKRLLVLDGAMGTELQNLKLTESGYRGDRFKDIKTKVKGNNDLLSLSRPDLVKQVHHDYLLAGADIIETNTFSANRVSMADYGMEGLVEEMNAVSAVLALESAREQMDATPGRQCYVAGVLGPTNKTASLSPDVNDPGARSINFDELEEIYGEQAKVLIKNGVDVLLIETIFDTLNAKAALSAVADVKSSLGTDTPVIVSGTVTDPSGRTLIGQTVEAFYNSVKHADVLSIGLNCAFGATRLKPFIRELASISEFPLNVHPNAGMPNQFGEYEQTPEEMVSILKEYLEESWVNIIGGCCGTGPEHIRQLSAMTKHYSPRKIPVQPRQLKLSGLEALNISNDSNFVNIGERTNVAGSKKFARLIREENYEEALEVARHQIENGAMIIDVCMDDAMIDSKKAVKTFLNLAMAEPEIAKVPVMVDSSDWEVILTGVKCVPGKPLVNSISLKNGEKDFLQKAQSLKKIGAAVIVMLFDEHGQAAEYRRKIEIARRSYDLLVKKAAFPAEDIIFDPNVLAIATGMEEHSNYAVDFLQACRWIKQHLPHVKISGGVSNLSFSFRGNNPVREAMNSVFLYHAIKAGMDMGIVNPALLEVYDNLPPELLARAEDVVLNKREDATERLVHYAEHKVRSPQKTKETEELEWRKKPLEERLKFSLIKGIDKHIIEDTEQARQKYNSVIHIIEHVLMKGMDKVGELFGDGKMFLPQVVKSARVMQKAVEHLEPYLAEELAGGGKSTSSGKIILATVKGDVHDIGKNIVRVILSCNNYEVIDLGVMVNAETILDKAEEENADMIGLSGLITPSLLEMESLAKQMQKRGMKTPLLIGGATTSKEHTAVKIADAYDQPVIHVKDASQSVTIANKLMNGNTRKAFLKEIKQEYAGLREKFRNTEHNTKLGTLKQVRANPAKGNWEQLQIVKPAFTGVKVIHEQPLEELIPYIDWRFYWKAWNMKASDTQIPEHTGKGETARSLQKDTQNMLEEIVQEHLLKARAVFAFYPVTARKDDILVYAEESDKQPFMILNFLRSQHSKAETANACLSDFVLPKSNGQKDYMGFFALTAGIGSHKTIEKFRNARDDYRAIMTGLLADRLAEAFAEKLHQEVRIKHWGYAPHENSSPDELLKQNYQGIRPAIGYPSIPDHSEKKKLFTLLDPENRSGIKLTENYMMIPAASVCGYYFMHPHAKYFNVGKIDREQLADYAARKGISINQAEKYLHKNLQLKRENTVKEER